MRHIIEHFEGYITDISDDKKSFWVRMVDIEGEEWEAEFEAEKVIRTEADWEWYNECGVGAYFDWIICNNETDDFWFIKERWTQEDLDRAKREGEKLYRLFNKLEYDEEYLDRLRSKDMLVMLPMSDDDILNKMRRTGHTMICNRCNHFYIDHPYIENCLDQQGHPYLHYICDGSIVKL